MNRNNYTHTETRRKYNFNNFLATNNLEYFKEQSDNRRYVEHYPTGFSDLDRVTSGGLEEGFGILCGVSGSGKTTLMVQMAYNISKVGTPVIMFSLEQETNAILAKMVSLQSYLNDNTKFMANQILCKEGLKDLKIDEAIAYKKAVSDCDNTIKNVIIVDRNNAGVNINSDYIEDFVEDFIKQTGMKPVVFVDYLQRLAPNSNADNQQTMAIIDANTETLWNLAHRRKLCICAISSLNRESYKLGATLEGQKGSGNIEYSADWALGIQFAGFKSKTFDINFAKSRFIRDVEIVILKQRLGMAGTPLTYEYIPAYNVFSSVEEWLDSLDFEDDDEDDEDGLDRETKIVLERMKGIDDLMYPRKPQSNQQNQVTNNPFEPQNINHPHTEADTINKNTSNPLTEDTECSITSITENRASDTQEIISPFISQTEQKINSNDFSFSD